MPIPTQKQIELWRARWGSEDNPDDVKRIRDIVQVIQRTRDDEKTATAELIEYLKNNMNIESIANMDFVEIYVPDLRGFRLDFLPKEERDLTNINMSHWYLESAILWDTHLGFAKLFGAHLESVEFIDANLKSVNLSYAHLEMAYLSYTNLETADLSGAQLESTYLSYANIEAADLRYAKLYKKEYMPARMLDEKYKGSEQLVEKEMKADFKGTTFKPRLRHQLYRFKPNKYRNYFESRIWKLPKYISDFPFTTLKPFKLDKVRLPIIFGRLKTANFIGVSIEGVDWSGNRMLERYIKDQQFLDEFRRNHPGLYRLWNITSKCGQSIPRLAFWILFVILGFALIFHNFEVINLLQQDKLPGFWASLYTSVNIFSNLGMDIKEPATKIGAVLIMIETMLGFVALGLLLTVAGSRFARRS